MGEKNLGIEEKLNKKNFVTGFVLGKYLPGKILRFKGFISLAAPTTCLGRQVITCIFNSICSYQHNVLLETSTKAWERMSLIIF